MKRGVKKTGSPKKESQPVQRPPRAKKVATGIAVPAQPVALLSDVRELIQQAREGVARAIDSGLVALHWHVGRRIRQDILKEKRAEYGQKIVSALGTQLSVDFGRGFDEKSLRHMVRFAEVFPDEQIVSALRRQLSWSEEHVALLELNKSGIHVASYLKKLLPKAELERKLHDAVRLARARLEPNKE